MIDRERRVQICGVRVEGAGGDLDFVVSGVDTRDLCLALVAEVATKVAVAATDVHALFSGHNGGRAVGLGYTRGGVKCLPTNAVNFFKERHSLGADTSAPFSDGNGVSAKAVRGVFHGEQTRLRVVARNEWFVYVELRQHRCQHRGLFGESAFRCGELVELVVNPLAALASLPSLSNPATTGSTITPGDVRALFPGHSDGVYIHTTTAHLAAMELPLELWEIVGARMRPRDILALSGASRQCYHIAHAVAYRCRLSVHARRVRAWTERDPDVWTFRTIVTAEATTIIDALATNKDVLKHVYTLRLRTQRPVWPKTFTESDNPGAATHLQKFAGIRELDLRHSQITDATALGRVRKLCLRGCFSLTDVHMFARAHTLSLHGCWGITDVSALGRVRVLNLSGTSVVDVSMLGGVRTLDLSRCERVVDVSALGNVHALNLNRCKRVTDVSALGNVHTLDLGGTNVVNVSALRAVHTLNLYMTPVVDVRGLESVRNLNISYTRIADVSGLGSVRNLVAIHCQEIRDVSALANAHTVNFSQCNEIVDVRALGNVRTLHVEYCRKLAHVPPLPRMRTLDLSGTQVADVRGVGRARRVTLMTCPLLTDVSGLGGVVKLDISYCDRVTDVSMLGGVKHLTLDACIGVTDVSGLGTVHTLNLAGCVGVTDVSMLGNVHTLNLSHTGVTDVSGLGTVHTLTLFHCTGVTDVRALSRVHALNLSGCTGVTDVSGLGTVHTLYINGVRARTAT